MQRFARNDSGYLGWLAANPGGFVINAARNPAVRMVLHRAGCGSIGGVPAHGSRWTTHSAKLCGQRNELEAFARSDLGHELYCCGLCLGGPAPDRERKASPGRAEAKRTGAAHEAPVADADSGELVLSGPEAKAAARQYLPWLWGWLALVATTWVAAKWLWHRSSAQQGYLGLGGSMLVTGALVWRSGFIWFSYDKSNEESTLTLRPSPVPRRIAAPALAAVGLCLILAAVYGSIASLVGPVVGAATIVVPFIKATWSAILSIAVLGIIIKSLVSPGDREDRKGAGCLLVFIAVGMLLAYAWARLTGQLNELWSELFGPYLDMWHLLERIHS